MSESSSNNPLEKLLQMQQHFKEKLPERLSGIESAWLELKQEKITDFTDFHMRIHSLVGAAGSFGATMVSDAARKLEDMIKLLLNNTIQLDDEIKDKIEYLIVKVKTISDKWQPSSIPYIPEEKKLEVTEKPDWISNVYIVEDDVEVADTLIQFLEKSGYKSFYYRKIKEFEEGYKEHEKASAIIMDMSFNEGIVAGADTIKMLSEKEKDFPPVIFISVHDDLQARLAAAQAGAKRYLTKPINQKELLACLDTLTKKTQDEAYRVLLIDDDLDTLEYYSAILKSKGIEVISFTDPFEGYRSIERFHPELVVLDLYIPNCSGFDLAKVIRQNDNNSSLPIVFLSSEVDMEAQYSAMEVGGDDFLVKSMDETYFFKAIEIRVKRARSINLLNDRIKNALRESEYRLIALDQHAIISMSDTTGCISFVNQHFINISGYFEEELIGQNHRILKSGKHDQSFYEDMWKMISKGEIWKGNICNKNKNGNEYWVDSTIVPFMDEHGVPYKYVSVRTDITDIKKSEEIAIESEKSLLDQQVTKDTLTTITDFILIDQEIFFSIVVQRAAEILDIERVSIWMLGNDSKEIVCSKQFELSKNNWDKGLLLKQEDYPNYFSALEHNTIIVASNAHTHSATSGFSEGYLKPLGIGAMLDIPIRRHGALIGIICCEHVGGKRHWRADEQDFISALADLVAINLESTERKKMEILLAEAKDNADMANMAKSEFLSNMSHELRTPMNAISGFAQLIVMDEQHSENDNTHNNANEILEASNHLLELINQLLNLSKIEAGEIDLSIESIRFSSMVLECVTLTSSLLESQDIKLSYKYNGKDISEELFLEIDVYLLADKTRFKQVLINLLSNAVKYNIEQGKVLISCDLSAEMIRINIVDTGTGISKSNLKSLFSTFNRFEHEFSDIEGTGLGLVITKNLVGLMDGNIGVESEVGVGSTFWFELPLVI